MLLPRDIFRRHASSQLAKPLLNIHSEQVQSQLYFFFCVVSDECIICKICKSYAECEEGIVHADVARPAHPLCELVIVYTFSTSCMFYADVCSLVTGTAACGSMAVYEIA